MQQKIEIISNVVQSIKNNPKFIKLLIYSMNSLENFVSPPNREIRVNARIIIKYDGIGALKAIAQININNDEVVETAGDIIWKCISFNDIIDMELAKLFADSMGHESVIEILLCKDKSQSSKPYIKILNGLSQIPNLIQKLINSGLIETVKLVSDIYSDDFDVIGMNFEIMKKISNLKIGRETLIKKNLIPNILKNISLAAQLKNTKGVLVGLNIIDNITRVEEGKDFLKSADIIKNLSDILDYFENNDEVLKIGAKIYSKISKPEDILNEIEKLKKYYESNDFSDLIELKKTLVLISNFILVDEISKTLCEDHNLRIIKILFLKISNINLQEKNGEYIKSYVLLNKYFMIIFHRIFNLVPEFFENAEIEANINKSILNNWNAINLIRQFQSDESDEELKSFTNAFSEYFSSFAEFFEKNYNKKIPEENLILSILDFFLNDKVFINDEKANNSACKVIRIANRIKNNSQNVKQKITNLFDFLISTVRFNEDSETLNYALEILHDIYLESFSKNSISSLEVDKEGFIRYYNLILKNQNAISENALKENVNKYFNLRDILLKVVIEFMMKKPKHRKPNLSNLKILNITLIDPVFLDLYKKNPKDYCLIDSVISVMAKHIYESSNIFEVVAIDNQIANSIKTANEINDISEGTEKLINYYGIKILEKLIDEKEILRMLKIFKDFVYGFIPGKSLPDAISGLENSMIFFFCVLKVKAFFSISLAEVIDTLKNLIKKEINFIENFKKDNLSEQKKDDNYLDTIKASNKRLRLQTALLKLISENCIRFYEEALSNDSQANIKNSKNLGILKEILKIVMDIFEKSSDEENICGLLEYLKDNMLFLSNNESELNTTDVNLSMSSIRSSVFAIFGGGLKDNSKPIAAKFEETIIEKLTSNLINLLRKNFDNINITKNIIEIFRTIIKKKPEISDLLVKAGCPRLLITILENTQDIDLAKKALLLFKTLSLSSEENSKMLSNQNIFDKLFEINTKFNNIEEIKEICNSIISQLAKLLDQSKFINNLVDQCIKNLNTTCSNEETLAKTYEGNKNIILENLEKINTFANSDKIISEIFDENLLSKLKLIQDKFLADPEISEINDKICFNLLDLVKKAYKSNLLKDSEKYKEEDFIDLLISIIKEKSHYRDPLLEALKTLSKLILNQGLFDKTIKSKINNDFIDSLFNASENYLEDLPISSEINNLLCIICIRSEALKKYIVEKGGLQHIIDEIKSILKLNDPISQSKKLFGLKFIESLVKDQENMEKFIKFRGADLVLNLMKISILFQEEENHKKIENLHNSESSQIIKHNNFVVRNSVLSTKNSEKSLTQNLKENGIDLNISTAEPVAENMINQDSGNLGFGVKIHNPIQLNEKQSINLEGEEIKFGSEIIENLKNENSLLFNNSSEANLKNCKLSIIVDYITETCIKIYDTNLPHSHNKRNSLDDSNLAYNLSQCKNSFADDNKILDEGYLNYLENKYENFDAFESHINKTTLNTDNIFISYLVHCFKIIELNLKFNMKDFIDPRLFKIIIQLLKNNFPNMRLFNIGVKLLSSLLRESPENETVILEDNDKKKLTQLILSNLAIFNTYKPLENSSLNLLKNLNYNTNDFKDLLIEAIENIENFNIANNNKIDNKLNSLPKFSNFPENSEIKSRFLTFVALYAENILTENPNESLINLIEIYFEKIIKNIFFNNDPSSIGFIKNEGFCLAMVKLRLFLIKQKYPKSENNNKNNLNNNNKYKFDKKVSILSNNSFNSNISISNNLDINEENKLKNINDKILRIGLSYFDPNKKFVNKFLKDFDEIYENLNIKYNPEKASFIMDEGKEIEREKMLEFLNDFYDYKNTIFLQSFFFYDHLCQILRNSEKILDDFMDSLNLIVNHVISCCDLKTERNYLGSSVKKNSTYLMGFIMNDYLNEEKKNNLKIKKLIEAFWKMLYYVMKNDEVNVICSNEELIGGLLNKLNEEIKNNPDEDIYRKIYSLIASKIDNNLELFNKIIENIQPEIISLEVNDKNEKLLLYDVEALNNMCRFNIESRILMKKEKEDLLSKLKQLFNNKSINEKLKYMLANIFSNLMKNRVNHEKLIENHRDLLAKILENLEDPNSKEIFETKIETQITNSEIMNTDIMNDDQYQSTDANQNIKYIQTVIPTEANDNTNNIKELLNKKDNSPLGCSPMNLEQLELFKNKEIHKKTLDKQIYSFVRFAKQNIGQLIKLNIIDKKNLENLKLNFDSDQIIVELIENILKNLTDHNKENELINSLNNLKLEIDALCKFVSEAYKEHCNQINFNKSLNDQNISDTRQDNIIRRSIRLSVQNIVAKISASNKKMSIFSQALIFTKQNSSINSPLSCKNNEEIQLTIEKMLNHLLQLYNDLKVDLDTNRNLERRILMSSLLNGLKLLSVAPSNHVQILEMGMLNLIEKINHDTEELNSKINNKNSNNEDNKINNEIPAFLQLENLDITKNCTTSESAIPLFISSNVADKIILEIFEIYKNPNIIQNDENLRTKFRSSNKIFSNLCQNKKGFTFVFDKLGFEKLLELAKNTYDETIIDSILEMIINFINNNTKSEIEKYLMNIFMLVIKAYKVYDNNREKIDLLTKAILIIGLLCYDETQEIINQFDFTQETCKFDLNLLLNNLQFLNAFSFALGKLSYNNPKMARSCFETGIIYKLNDLIPDTLNIFENNNNKNNSSLNKQENVDESEKTKESSINFAFLENISSLYRNILKNNLKIIPKFLEKSPLANEPNKLKYFNLKNSEIEISSHMLTIMERLIETSPNCPSINITIYNLAEAFEFICMDDNAIVILANTNFMNLSLNILTVKQGEAEIVRILMHCISNYFNKEIGNNFNNTNFDKILQILRGIQKRYYLNSDILMTINNISYCLIKNLIKEKDKLTRESLFNIILESINIQDWNIPLLLTALKIIFEILRKKENKYIIDLIYDDHINSFLGIIRNHQNDSEILCVDYKILSLFAENKIYGYAMINNNLLELIQETLIKLDVDLGKITSAKDLELKQTIFSLLEKLCQDKNSAKKIADAITENLIMELKHENPAAPSANASNILKLFQTITQHPNTVEGFLQQNGLEYILNFLKMDALNVNNDLNCLSILEHISKNGNNYKKKLKEAKTVEVISDVMEKTKNINKEINILGGMIINDINDIQLDLQKNEELNIEEVKKKSSPIKPEIKNFLTNGKIVRLIDMSGKKKQMLLIMTQDMLRIMAKKLNTDSPPKDKYIIEISQIKKIVRGYANDSYTKSMGFFTKVFGNPPLPQRCFSIYANSRDKEKVLNVKCVDEKEANDWIEYLKIVIEHMSKTKTIRNAVQFTSTYKK